MVDMGHRCCRNIPVDRHADRARSLSRRYLTNIPKWKPGRCATGSWQWPMNMMCQPTIFYVFNQSKQHKRISANVSGIGPTIRISLNDNLLERTSPEEVAAVMGPRTGALCPQSYLALDFHIACYHGAGPVSGRPLRAEADRPLWRNDGVYVEFPTRPAIPGFSGCY